MADKLNITETTGTQVYLREVPVDSLPERLRVQVDGVDTIYALTGEDGKQIALVISRAGLKIEA